ncbi:MAG: hypothetical protein HY695_12060 [Deltaproteobacteria bacterium]|nr:hypothetical protein [Deltaproteobacteria bacterium]
MRKPKENRVTSHLAELVRAADAAVLGRLVERLAGKRPDIQRECLEFLQKQVASTVQTEADTEAAALFALWQELEPDLAELDEYGGGDHDTEDLVGELLYELCTKLERSRIAREDRRSLLQEVLPYIRSGNAGMDDPLYDVAYATYAHKAKVAQKIRRMWVDVIKRPDKWETWANRSKR